MRIIDPAKKTYTGNIHTHTLMSDGRRSLDDAAKVYAALGHDFLCITDHWKLGEESRKENLLIVKGAEYDFPITNQALHLVALLPGGADPGVTREGDDAHSMIRKVNALGGCVILAHPAWSMNTLDTMTGLPGICGMEIFNAVSGLPYGNDRSYAGAYIDLAANAGTVLPVFSGDDTHYYNGEPGLCVNKVQADALTSEALIAAMKRGSCYCTQGPEVYSADYDPENRVYTVDCSPAAMITFYSNLPWVAHRCTAARTVPHADFLGEKLATSENVTHAEFHLQPKETWIRCEIVDAQGRKAFLPPVRA